MRRTLGIELTYLRVDTRTEGNDCWSISQLHTFFRIQVRQQQTVGWKINLTGGHACGVEERR